jgi:glutaminyl-peptide cyclotransferase
MFNWLQLINNTTRNGCSFFNTCLTLAMVLLGLVEQSLATPHVTPDITPHVSPHIVEYQFRIVNSYPHSRQVFTQGLEFHSNLLYESAGLRGRSSLQIRPLDSLKPLHRHRLDKQLFAEGITLFDNQLFQLTWRSGRAFIYRPDTLEPSGEFSVKGEGWGLTNNGKELIMSNGSSRLTFINPKTKAVTKTLNVTFQGKPLNRLNELEWINGLIYANVWQSNWIVMIEPSTGAVRGKVNLTGLLPKTLRTVSTDVLNGIAYDRNNDRLFVTGKNWPKLYQIELSEWPKLNKTLLPKSTKTFLPQPTSKQVP